MPKKNLLISAALTAFVLVMLTGVASAYKQVTANFVAAQATPTTAPTTVPTVEVAVVLPTEVIPIILTHQEAALVAANYLEQTDLFSVEIAIWEETATEAYKVVFSTGDIVYISMDGQILGVEEPPTIVITQSNNNGGNNNAAAQNDHDDDDDHDDDHDEDDDHDDDDGDDD